MQTPRSTSSKLDRDSDLKKVDPTFYRSMIGSLLYLAASRPNISFCVGICVRYQVDPREQHFLMVKRVIRYVNSILNYGLCYSSESNFEIAGYIDADWAGNKDDKKSTSGGCSYVGTNLVSWYNKKQNCIYLSSCEAEYITARNCCTQLLWMKQILMDYGFDQETIAIFCDNTSTSNISKNLVLHSRTKHIDIRYHFLRELVEQNVVSLEKVHTYQNLADILTKPLHALKFSYLRKSIGICCLD
ncbi:secreted RxLR effector protein 161-like [Cornus florida]|uniref:secreted RxLR effector protein 161-like n=1 Tax=Cornus florida TaxID=4283 RepID=UPI00289AC5FC|nr:secreted RxLR effector protein 161-like [Cornus florida]